MKRYIVAPMKDKGVKVARGGGEFPCLLASYGNGIVTTIGDRYGIMEVETKEVCFEESYRIRRLTPTECARLQSIPDWYEWKGMFEDGTVKPTSNSQIYKMLGNGWNVEVIKHIFSFINLENYERKQKE